MDIKTHTDAKGWSASHLTAALMDRGVTLSPATVERWMDGKHDPRACYLPMIADALGVTVDDLIAARRVEGRAV